MADEIVVKKLIIKVEGDTSDLESDLKKTGQGAATWSVALGNMIASGIQTAVTGMVSAVKGSLELVDGLIANSVEDAISLESAFAGVVKTTAGLADEAGNLTDIGSEMQTAFRDMAKEIPQDVEDLMGLGALGSQLGIQRENLVEFTKTMAMVGDATDLTSETAASAFAQIANVMGTSQDEISNMASSLVQLGNNMATTEPQIINFAQRIAGAGKVAGLTEADVFGIGAAFSSVGVGAEAGGTAVQKVLLGMNEAMLASTGTVINNSEAITKHTGSLSKMQTELAILQQKETEWTDKTKESVKMRHRLSVQQKESAIAAEQALLSQLQATNGMMAESEGQLEIFAKTAGISSDKFAEMWETNAAGAFQLFVEGLGAAGDDAVGILDELELKDQRLVSAFLSLSGAGDVLGEALVHANSAFEDNTALQEEAAARYRTTESQIALFKNTLRDMSFTIGGAVLPMLNEMLEMASPIISELGERLPGLLEAHVVPALQAAIGWIGQAIDFVASIDFAKVGDDLTGVIVPAFNAIVAFVQEKVIPIFETIVGVFQETIPVAIRIATEYFEAYLLPVFEALVDQWTMNVQPALAELFMFLAEFIPEAVKQVGIVWDEVLQPAFAWLANFLVTQVIPVLGMLVTWLIENVPVALTALMSFWTEIAWPAILASIEWFQENAMPIIELVIAWLQENIPVALEFLRATWVDVVWPAILEAVEWFKENALPIIEDIIEWFMVTLPAALETLRKVWADDVWPAIETAIKAADVIITEIFRELDRWINVNIVPWIQELQRVWAEDVWPAISKALEDAWKLIEPIWLDIKKWLDETIPDVIETVSTAWDKLWGGIQKTVEDAWKVVGDIFDKVIKFLDDIASKTLSFKIKLPDIPDWAMPGSPLPIHTAWKEFAEWSRSAEIRPSMSVDAIEDTTMSVLDRVQSERTTNVRQGDVYELTANYPAESQVGLVDRVRRLQLENSISMGAT